jgi:hypothetical protein
LSPGGASGVFMFAATFKKPPDDVIKKSAIQLPIYNGLWQLYASHWVYSEFTLIYKVATTVEPMPLPARDDSLDITVRVSVPGFFQLV